MNRNEVSEAIVHDLGALFEAEVHGGASVVDSGSGRDGQRVQQMGVACARPIQWQ